MHIIALPVENTYVKWFHRPRLKRYVQPQAPKSFLSNNSYRREHNFSPEAAYLGLAAMHTMGCHVSFPTNSNFTKQDLSYLKRSVWEWCCQTWSCDSGKHFSQPWKPKVQLNYSKEQPGSQWSHQLSLPTTSSIITLMLPGTQWAKRRQSYSHWPERGLQKMWYC